MDQRLLARDSSGLYVVRKLTKATGAGHVVQVIEPGTSTGLHRTWHADGRVHDRTTNPPSTLSTGIRPPPKHSANEGWVQEDLVAGTLASRFAAVTEPAEASAIVYDLKAGPTAQRAIVRYTTPGEVATTEASIRGEYGAKVLWVRDYPDGTLTRVIAAIDLST